MLEEYDKAELTAARDESCSVRTYFAPKGNDEEIADLTSEENTDAANALTADKEPGQSEVLPIGWKQEIHTPQHPNRELTAFKTSMLKDVASGFSVEYSNLANDWAGVSFSSVRSGTISERDMYITDQNDYIAQNKSPIFLAWLRSFLSYAVSGGLPAAKFDKFSEHEIRGRRWMWVDPMKDMNAAKMAVENGWKTNSQVASDMGTDYGDNVEQIKREDALGLPAPRSAVAASQQPKESNNENAAKK
jgi:lambda family phage portal protein